MKYDFNEIIKRENTSSYKYDMRKTYFNNENAIPLWVADMDLSSPKELIDALVERAKHPIYGYTLNNNEYYNSLINWNKKRHNLEIKKEWIKYSPGVVPGVAFCIQALTNENDKIILPTPIYYPFYSMIEANNRKLLKTSLVEKSGTFIFNYEEIEKFAKEGAKIFLLCNPHNPIGRVWKKEELVKLYEICKKYNLLIISDEIHSDIIFKGNKFTSILEIDENAIVFNAPSKTFNIAGLNTAFALIPNKEYRKKYDLALIKNGLHMGNVFGIEAFTAAYKYGEDWLNQALEYIKNNLNYLIDFTSKNMPKIKIVKPEGTYLVWIDFREMNFKNQKELEKFIYEKSGIGLNSGLIFGKEGQFFMRMNIAHPTSIIEKALENLKKSYDEILI